MGALSNRTGTVNVSWRTVEPGSLWLTWHEQGGPPVREPKRPGVRLAPDRDSDRAFATGHSRAMFHGNRRHLVPHRSGWPQCWDVNPGRPGKQPN